MRYLATVLACAVTTAIAVPLQHYFDLANIVMLFLLVVVLIALRLGRGPAVAAAFLCVALFDFFFVPPQLSFAVNDVQYLLTFAVMLTVALVIGQLTAGLRHQAKLASTKEERMRALYELARELAGSMTAEQVSEVTLAFVRRVIGGDACLLHRRDGALRSVETADAKPPGWVELVVAETACEVGACMNADTSPPCGYFALNASGRARGVLAVLAPDDHVAALEDNDELLKTVGSLAGVALERLHYVEVANEAQIQMASERLRSSILASLSHDVRTPLTALVGLADSLTVAKPALPPQQHETAQAVRDQAMRLSSLVSNLLDMARLHAGTVKLRKEWQPLEEVVGSSIKLLGQTLGEHRIDVELASDLPLIEFDSVLIERVFCNLLENAAKYSAPHSRISVSAKRSDEFVAITIRDEGPGVPPDHHSDIFKMFVRGRKESPQPGVGLGLAICRAIVEAHGGSISITNESPGASFVFTLPLGNPPVIDADELSADLRDE